MLGAVLRHHVIDDLAPPVVGEVDIDIGHAYPLGIEEPLKDQSVFYRVGVGDVQCVSNYASGGRTSSRSDHYTVFLRVMHIIPYDQEVVDKAHLLYSSQLCIEPFRKLLRDCPVLSLHALFAQLAQIFVVLLPVRDRVFREMQLAEFELDVAALRDLHRIVTGLRYRCEDVPHLLLALEIELVVRISHAVFIVYLGPCLDAQQHIVRLSILLLYVMDVVRRHERDARLLVQTLHQRQYPCLLFEPLILQFEIIVSLTEYLEVFEGFSLRPLIVSRHQKSRDHACKTRGKTYQSFAMFPEDVLVYTRLIVMTLYPARRNKLYKVLISRLVFRQKDEMILPSVGLFVT